MTKGILPLKDSHISQSHCPTLLQVSIQCTVLKTHKNAPAIAVGDNCLNTIQGNEVTPFHADSLNPGVACPYTPITVRYKYRLCNTNSEHKIKMNSNSTWIRFDGLDIDFNKGKIQPNQCRKIVIDRNFNLCDVNSIGLRTRGMEVQLHGSMKGTTEQQFCYCKCGVCYCASCIVRMVSKIVFVQSCQHRLYL